MNILIQSNVSLEEGSDVGMTNELTWIHDEGLNSIRLIVYQWEATLVNMWVLPYQRYTSVVYQSRSYHDVFTYSLKDSRTMELFTNINNSQENEIFFINSYAHTSRRYGRWQNFNT